MFHIYINLITNPTLFPVRAALGNMLNDEQDVDRPSRGAETALSLILKV